MNLILLIFTLLTKSPGQIISDKYYYGSYISDNKLICACEDTSYLTLEFDLETDELNSKRISKKLFYDILKKAKSKTECTDVKKVVASFYNIDPEYLTISSCVEIKGFHISIAYFENEIEESKSFIVIHNDESIVMQLLHKHIIDIKNTDNMLLIIFEEKNGFTISKILIDDIDSY